MGNIPAAIIIAAIFVCLILLMLASWRRRLLRDAALRPAPVAQAARGELLAAVDDANYVVTTVHDEPLQRLAIAGLAYRGTARVAVYSGGVGIRVTGEDEVFLHVDSLIGAGHATWTIDRAVEKDGLVLVGWRPTEETSADSYLRIVDPALAESIIDAIASISADGLPAGSNNSEEKRG